jgi:hypothetical protein
MVGEVGQEYWNKDVQLELRTTLWVETCQYNIIRFNFHFHLRMVIKTPYMATLF